MTVTRFTEIWDKGKAAVIWSEITVGSPEGILLGTQKRSIFARGVGGFGGEHGRQPRPGRQTARRTWNSTPGSRPPLGFPILHGLCTYGMTCKALVDAVLGGDAGALGSYGARMAGVVFPGETLRVTAWEEDGRYLGNVTVPDRDGAVALGDVEFTPA